MANLIQQLRPASYRGVSFGVPGDTAEFGARIVSHQYPDRDEPFQEDLGADVDKFTITALVGGWDYIAAARSLEAALRKKGPGTLIHPHYGEIEVVHISSSREHNNSEVGYVLFTINFEKYGAPRFPSAALDTVAGLGLSSSGLFSAIKGNFNGVFKGTGIPDFLADDALGRVTDFTTELRSIFSKGGLSNLVGDLLPAWSSIESLADGIVDLFQSIGGRAVPKKKPILGPKPAASATPAQVTSLVRCLTAAAVFTVADQNIPATGTAATRQVNARAIDNIFRTCAVAAIASVAQYATYESVEQAVAVRAAIGDSISAVRDQLGADGWDDSWRAAGTVRAALTRDVNDRIGRLPRTVLIRPPSVRTSLDLANRLYGDDPAALFDRAADIAKRNGVRHPGFVPVKNMEVLIAS